MVKKKTVSGKSEKKETKSIASSGTAKKAAPKSAKKKLSPKAAPKKKATGKKIEAKKTAKKKAAPKKKAPIKKATAAKSGTGAKGKKALASKKKPASIKNLLFKKFETPVAGKKYSPPPVRREADDISSPPFFVGKTTEETERIRRLLFKKFDAPAVEAEEKVGARSAPESKTKPRERGARGDGAAAGSPGKKDTGKASAATPFTGMEASAPVKKPLDPTQKMAAAGIACLAFLLAMVLWSSASNLGKFYIKPVNGKVEIWKGKFSPKGVEKIITLNRTSVPVDLKEVYSKEEAVALIFEGVVNDADALLNTEEMPNFDLIRRTLESARPFAISADTSLLLQKRLDKIDMMALVYKADVFSGKGTVADLKRARESLEKALRLDLDEAEKGLIEQKMVWVDQKLAEMEEE